MFRIGVRPTGGRHLSAALVLALLAIVYALRVGPPATYPAFGFDNSVYLVSAKALAEGHGYVMIDHPEQPPVRYYPIGYPAFLAVLLRFVSIDAAGITILRASTALACLVSLAVGYRILRRYTTTRLAAGATLLIGLQPWVLLWAGEIFSESLFALGVAVSVLCAGSAAARTDGPGWWRAPLLAGLFAGGAMLTRTVGVTVIAGILVAFAVNRQWRTTLVFMAAAGAMMLPWISWSALNARDGGSLGDYAAWILFHFDWNVPLKNAWDVASGRSIYFPFAVTQAGQAAIAGARVSWLIPILGVIVTGILLTGLVALARRRDVVAWCLLFYLPAIILMPWENQILRYAMPVYPLLAVPLLTGWALLRARRAQFPSAVRAVSVCAALTLALNVVGLLAMDALMVGNVYAAGHSGGRIAADRWRHQVAAFEWIRHNLPKDAIIISVYAHGVYLFTERLTISTIAAERSGAEQGLVSDLETILAGTTRTRPVFVFARETYLRDTEVSVAPLKEFASVHPERVRLRWQSPDRKMILCEILPTHDGGPAAPLGMDAFALR